MTNKNQSKIEVQRSELVALHSCIAIVINKGIPSNEDCAFLMEAMTHIADQEKKTKKSFNVKIDHKYIKGLWHCCKVVLDNDLQKDHVHATDISKIMSKIAIEIDKIIAMDKKPSLELVK